MKKEHILAFPDKYISDLLARFGDMQLPYIGITVKERYARTKSVFIPFTPLFSYREFLAELEEFAFTGRREELEKAGCHAVHPIPYITILNARADIYVYQRGKMKAGGDGEIRLAGGDSIGLGGHVSAKKDVVYREDESIDVQMTINLAAHRETYEEVSIGQLHSDGSINHTFNSDSPRGSLTSKEHLPHIGCDVPNVFVRTGFDETQRLMIAPIMPAGLIIDHSDDVGKYHLGISYVLQLEQEDLEVRSNEKVIIDRGFFSTFDLQSNAHGAFGSELINLPDGPLKLESWSKIVLENVVFETIPF